LCNFDPGALLLVTPVSADVPPQARAAGVTYNSNIARWQLFPTDPAGAFPAGQRFNILIIKP
jgi:hypothetical protein